MSYRVRALLWLLGGLVMVAAIAAWIYGAR